MVRLNTFLLITMVMLSVVLQQAAAYSVLRMDKNNQRSVQSLRDNPLCTLGSVQNEMVTPSFAGKGSLSTTFAVTRLSVDVEPEASLCLFVSAPLSGVTLSLSVAVADTTVPPTAITVAISQNGEPAASETLVVTGTTTFGPIFFAPAPDAVPSLDVANQTFSIAVTPVNASAGSAWDLTLASSLSLFYWPAVPTDAVAYPDFNGLALGAPLPVPLNSKNQTDTSANRQFKYSYDFGGPLPFNAVVSPCLTVSAPGCTPVPAGSCLSTGLSSVQVKKGAASFSGTFQVKTTNLGATGCPADGIQVRLLPVDPDQSTTDLNIKSSFSTITVSSKPSGLSTGAIIGIAAGVAVALILVILLGVYVYRRKQHSDYQEF